MRSFTRYRILLMAVLGLYIASFMPAAATQAASSYESTAFDYTIAWGPQWSIDDSTTVAVEGVMELLVLFHDDGFVMVGAYNQTYISVEDMLEPSAGQTVIEEDLNAEVPYQRKSTEFGIDYSEAYYLADGTLIIVTASAPEADIDSLVTDARDSVTINGNAVFTGEPLAEGTGTTGQTATETTSSTGRPRRGTATEVATEQSTVVATETATSTSRPRRGVATEQATEVVTQQETPEIVVPEGHDSYTGSVYNYTLHYQADVWEKLTVFETETSDGIRLQSENGRLTVWTWDAYGTDSVACLDGEAEYFATEDDTVSEMELVTDAQGKPLRHESEELSWGVYSLVYTSDSGRETTLIDYIACQPIPGEDAMLIVLFSALPEDYNAGLDETLDVLESIQYATGHDASVTPNDPTPAPTAEPADPDSLTSLDGSLYTSPSYGFTVDIPLEWDVVSEESHGNNERLILSNGTSDVTLWATSEYQGDVTGCVDYAASQSGLNLQLDRNASGGDFRGVYGKEAFANFVYEDGGTTMLYFVSCQPIPGTDGFLILIQDVEYSMFSTERKFRSDIENGISMP